MAKILMLALWGIIAIIVAKIAINIFYDIFPPDISGGLDQNHALIASLVGIISALPFLIFIVKSNSQAPIKKSRKVNQEALQDKDNFYDYVKEVKRKILNKY